MPRIGKGANLEPAYLKQRLAQLSVIQKGNRFVLYRALEQALLLEAVPLFVDLLHNDQVRALACTSRAHTKLMHHIAQRALESRPLVPLWLARRTVVHVMHGRASWQFLLCNPIELGRKCAPFKSLGALLLTQRTVSRIHLRLVPVGGHCQVDVLGKHGVLTAHGIVPQGTRILLAPGDRLSFGAKDLPVALWIG